MIQTITYIYFSTLLIAAVIFLARYRILDPATRVIAWMVWAGLFTEAIARYAAIQYRNNLPVYNVFFYIYFLLIMLYFYRSNAAIRNSRLMHYLVPAVLLAGILSTLFFKPFLTTLNVHLLTLKFIVISVMALYSLKRVFLLEAETATYMSQVHFWIPMLLLLGQTATVFSWAYYQPWNELLGELGKIPDYTILFINILVYAGFGVLALRYPRLKSRS
jgi:hypothetical protein